MAEQEINLEEYDQKIYPAIETIVDSFWKIIPRTSVSYENSRKMEKDVLKALPSDYSERVAVTVFRTCYWYLMDKKMLQVDVVGKLYYSLSPEFTEKMKFDICSDIYFEYEKYLQAHYLRSLTEPLFYDPNPFVPAPDSSPGQKKRPMSGGK